MPKSVLQIKSADEVEAVFYEAFMRCDIEVMKQLWGDGEVVCVHPGSGLISGHDAVVRSWRHILENANPAEIRYTLINKTETSDLAVHVVVEEILQHGVTSAMVLATNVYRKFARGWFMIEHHASLVPQSPKGRTLQ